MDRNICWLLRSSAHRTTGRVYLKKPLKWHQSHQPSALNDTNNRRCWWHSLSILVLLNKPTTKPLHHLSSAAGKRKMLSQTPDADGTINFKHALWGTLSLLYGHISRSVHLPRVEDGEKHRWMQYMWLNVL